MTVRVLVADDQALLRAGFRKLLETRDDLQVVADADSGEAAVEAARLHLPDIALMDIRMPGLDGIEATRRILGGASPRTRVVMLTMFALDEYVYESLRAGASGFLLKDAPPEDLLAAIDVVARGDAMLSPAVTRRVIEEYSRSRPRPSGADPRLAQLSPRELEVLRLLTRGCSNAEIAQTLVVSDATAKTHVTHILTKLRVRDRVQAVILAYESGLVRPGEASPATWPDQHRN
jgi:DNA-binding NarL/FixJ family response regulator